MNRFILLITALLFTVTTAGCNTVQGFGQDLKSGGESIQKAATH